MKKNLFLALAVTTAVLFTAGCNSEKSDESKNDNTAVEEKKAETPVPAPTTTTTVPVDNTDYELLATCVDALSSVSEGLDAVAEGAALLPYVGEAEALSFLATTKEFVQTSKVTVELCADLSPAEASYTLSALNELEVSVESLVDVYATY